MRAAIASSAFRSTGDLRDAMSLRGRRLRHHAHLTAFSDDHILPTEQITIRTTSDRVCWSFVCENDIYVGKVLYVDYERTDIGIENLLNLYQQRSLSTSGKSGR